jgi:hypothetical protein
MYFILLIKVLLQDKLLLSKNILIYISHKNIFNQITCCHKKLKNYKKNYLKFNI